MKKVTATWTIDPDSDLETEIGEDFSKMIQEEIDWEVMCAILKEVDWVEVKLEWPNMTAQYAHEVKEWCRSTLKGSYHGRGRTWIFEKEQDAEWFMLRWS